MQITIWKVEMENYYQFNNMPSNRICGTSNFWIRTFKIIRVELPTLDVSFMALFVPMLGASILGSSLRSGGIF